jgi:hypothetical protein
MVLVEGKIRGQNRIGLLVWYGARRLQGLDR